MGISYLFVFAYFASLLYPGVNLPATVAFTLIPGVVVSLIYYIFTVAMPRTGGDYVWVSRTLHPSLGYLTNFLITFALLSSVAVGPAWAVIYGLSPMFAGLSVLYPNSSYGSWASTLASTPTSFILTVILMSIFIIPLFFGTKTVFRVLWGLFIVAAIGTLVMVGAFYSAPNSTFVSNFNSLSGMDYSNTIAKAGLPQGFSLGMTLTGSIFTITNFLGFYTSAYYTGEVKQVRRSQIIAMIGSLLVMTFFAGLVYASAYYSAGSDFLNAASLQTVLPNSTWTAPAVPVLNFLVVFATPNALVVFLSGLALVVTGLATATIFTFVCVRNVFAWSFDRVMPGWLTRLDTRHGSPYLAVAIMWVFGVIFAYVYLYTPFFTYYVYSTLQIFIAFVLASIAAIFFPFRKKTVFNSSPSIVTTKVAGIPLLTILGVIGVIVNGYLGYATLQPAVTPPPSGPPIVQYIAYAIVPVTIVVALVIYGVAYFYRKSQGINLRMAFSEIPPE